MGHFACWVMVTGRRRRSSIELRYIALSEEEVDAYRYSFIAEAEDAAGRRKSIIIDDSEHLMKRGFNVSKHMVRRILYRYLLIYFY